MVFDNLLSFLIKNRLRKMRKLLEENDLISIKKQIEKYNFKKLQLVKKYHLINGLKHVVKNSPYYKDKMPPQIKDLKYDNALAIIPKLPFTTSSEVSKDSEQFLAIPKEDVVNIHFTYGTTGGKKTIYNSKRDMGQINYSYTLGFINCGIEKSDIAQLVYSFGVWGLAENIQRALLSQGIITLSTGNYVNFQEQQQFIEKFGTTVIFGTPSYVYNLAQECDLPQKSKDKMKAILVGGEGLPEHRRKIIEERLGGEVYINYGLNEVGGGIGSECKIHYGYHVFPSVHVEIVDPKTCETVDIEEYGELVVTTLNREAMPLIRYRTGDMTRLIDGECDCGLKLPRIDYLKGRADDKVIIGAAEKYYPINFDLLFDPIPEIKDYWIEISARNDKDALMIYVLTDKPTKKLEEKIIEKFYSLDSIKIDIETTKTLNDPEVVFIDKLPKGGKRRRLVDKRKFLK
ncbi:MAG: phenylacetate--CoA ligase family protein [Candidatus Heimdallarchaeota archaeon]|nr:phenylacetate--CoA ligase family protein [Candidatus Heimdallarchaeota archaeon]MBY8995864.1 phenylacetate--CoA ligase family protein [Candidatus Heimdallarchaeota archaeon]